MLALWVAFEMVSLKPPHALISLMYHRFGDGTYPTTNITMEQFKAHLDALKQANIEIISMDRFMDYINKGQEFPENMALITIDDGYRSFFQNAWPIISAQKIPVTLFISTEALDAKDPDSMNYEELRQIRNSGLVTFGGHGHAHNSFIRSPLETIRADIEKSQRRLKEELGITTPYFSFPYGEYNQETIKLVKEMGYKIAFGQHSGVAFNEGQKSTNPDWQYKLPRFSMNENYGNLDNFKLISKTIPLKMSDLLPLESHLGRIANDNHPLIGFTVKDDKANLASLRCYGSAGLSLKSTEILGPRVEIRLSAPLPKGRSRINCTLPTQGGKWYWLGIPFTVLN